MVQKNVRFIVLLWRTRVVPVMAGLSSDWVPTIQWSLKTIQSELFLKRIVLNIGSPMVLSQQIGLLVSWAQQILLINQFMLSRLNNICRARKLWSALEKKKNLKKRLKNQQQLKLKQLHRLQQKLN